MPHGGRSVDEVLAMTEPRGGAAMTQLMLSHALFEEEAAATDDGSLDLDAILDGDEDATEGAEGDGSSTGSSTSTGSQVSEEDLSITGLDQQFTEEVIERVEREFFDVQTPEAFLDDFFTSFSGFAVNAAAAGLSDADFEQMIDPQSGFMQQMLGEFIGEQASRALAGETPYEVVGVQGEPEFIGTREGDQSTTSFRRMTRTEAEQQLQRDGITVTEESIQQTIDDDFAQQQASATQTSESTQTTTEDTVDIETGTSEFSSTQDVFSRPEVAQVFKFSPTDFFLQKFALPEGLEQNQEGTDKFIGMISTQIRAAAPRNRPGGGGPTGTTISARRA